MKIIILAFRDWSTKVYEPISRHISVEKSVLCKHEDDLNSLALEEYDLLITIGLSNRLDEAIYSKIFTIGLHCAQLDRYSNGSPIQNQIIDNLLKTKHRIFPFKTISDNEESKVLNQVDSRQYSHEVDLYLHGNLNDIFNQLTYTSITLLNLFLDDYPDITWKKWPFEIEKKLKRNPEDSLMNKVDFLNYQL
jgi:hypothetical protein